MMQKTGLVFGLVSLATVLLFPSRSFAFQRYNDGCNGCHGHFATSPYSPPSGAANWATSLHLTHRDSAYMNTDCDLCHTNGDNRNPYLKTSNGTATTTGRGCSGCHGRDDGTGQISGAGLRLHHAGAGVTVCGLCHTSDGTPPPESVMPPYYGSADTNANFSCNDDVDTSEDWSGDGIGLDNDGDYDYDTNDSDCSASCGNGSLDPGETCDPPSSCPTTCDDGDACTVDGSTGTAATCDLLCINDPITSCTDNDGCCAPGCDATTDNDCTASCGNGVVEPGETCDPPGSCPSCDDGNACTADSSTGSAATCDLVCSNVPITSCTDNDGCCAPGCDATTDNDCTASCGNGVVEPGETCDPPGSCPASCDDTNACTTDSSTGSAATCTLLCINAPVTVCSDNDGCCPTGCDATTDNDCSSVCGNGAVEAGETCDPPGSCPTSCADFDACTADSATGSADTCTLACTHTQITACNDNDGCCPDGCTKNTDNDCSNQCGNGVINAGETCDPPGSCPATCDDSNACTADSATGSASTCDLTCFNTPITACVDYDGCCAPGCNATTDNDCTPSCGNGVVEPGETCDPPGSCPSCDDGNACTTDGSTGSAATCDLACSNTPISVCSNGDSCCPAGCNATNDDDCSPSCGNGVIEAGETCDPPGSCPTTCDDSDACTGDIMTGDAATCNVACSNPDITLCTDADGCCAPGCNETNDDDCSPVCGNSVLETGETCDPPGSCPTCDDENACTADTITGSASNCDVTCTNDPITACTGGDGCCPSGCNETNDSDCSPMCGNGTLETGETCDPPGSCPVTCNDSDSCTTDQRSGDASTCDVVCTNTDITSCTDDDGCCAPGCDQTNDNDCAAVCGNGVLESGETCDPPGSCPTSCDDGDSCTADTLEGSSDACNVTCTNTLISACTDDDGCCPSTCDQTNDNDCTAVCGNGVVEAAETCDPPSSCPSSCDDGDACTVDVLAGSAANCDVACTNTLVETCANGDGCCPDGCDDTNDNDCASMCAGIDQCIDADGCCPTSCGPASDSDCASTGGGPSGGCCDTGGGLGDLGSGLLLLGLAGLVMRRRRVFG